VGYVVKPISEEEVEEICEIRAVIEMLGTRWAVAKAHQKVIEELGENIRLSEKEVISKTPKTFVELDARFHEIIAKHSGSQRLLELSQMLRRHMLRYRVESIYSVDNVFRAIEGHRGILEAIKKADLEEMNRAIQDHLQQSKKDILKYAFKEETVS
jgi:DNA-binding GntR family transcriptional regulator